MKGCEGFDGCECEYCSNQEDPDCPINSFRRKLKLKYDMALKVYQEYLLKMPGQDIPFTEWCKNQSQQEST